MSKLKIEYKSIDKLIPYINNPRINDNAIDKVAASIKEFGFKVPIIVDKNNEINRRIKFYFITKDGECFRFWKNGKVDKQKTRVHSNGYLRAVIFGKDQYMHRLVAMCYIENPKNYKEINHKDGDKTNNNVWNLEWCNRQMNNKHAFKTGLRNADHMKQFANSDNHKKSVKRFRKLSEGQAKEIKKLIRQGKSDREISKIYNVSRGCIYGIRSNKTYEEVIA
jgi:hypothetical protein